MQTDFGFRLATESDEAWIYALNMHPAVNPYLLYEPMSSAAFRPIFAELLALRCKYVLTRQDTPVAMCKLVRHAHRDQHRVYVGGLAVSPSHARQGIGDVLMTAIERHCRQAGVVRMELSVSTENQRAISLYKRHGYVQEGVMQKFSYFRAQQRYLDEAMMARLL